MTASTDRPDGAWLDAIAFGPDSRVLLTGSFDNTARLWRITR